LKLLRRRERRAQGLGSASYGQKALWYIQQIAPESAAYNINSTMRVVAALNLDALTAAIGDLIARHESLRTSFTRDADEPVRRIHQRVDVPLTYKDCRRFDRTALNRALHEAAWSPFKLDEAPLFRMRVMRVGAQEYILSFTAHHIVGDFWSLNTCLRELGRLYLAHAAGVQRGPTSVPASYTDFVHWQEDYLDGPQGSKLSDFWQKELDGYSGVLDVATDYERPSVQTFEGAVVPFAVGPEVLAKVRAFAKAEGVTLFNLLLAAYQVMLWRYSGQTDTVVGAPMSGRTNSRFHETIGYFANLVPIRSKIEPEVGFRDWVHEVRRTTLAAMAHQDYPFPLIVERLKLGRDPRYSPLVQAAFMFEKSRYEEHAGLLSFLGAEATGRVDIGGLIAEPVQVERRSSQFDLTLIVEEANEQLYAIAECNSRIFRRRTIERFAAEWTQLLERLVVEAATPLARVSVLTPEEELQVLDRWNLTAKAYPDHEGIYDLFRRQVERCAEARAVVCGERSWTYRELHDLVLDVARRLAESGATVGSVVGVCVSRGVTMVATLLAMLRMGCLYVPLDATHPRRRIYEVLDDAAVDLLVSESAFLSIFNGRDVGTLVLIDDATPQPSDYGPAAKTPDPTTYRLAYLLYTSGTTGTPKGVAVRQSALVNVLLDVAERIGIKEDDQLLAITTIAFDIAALEIFMPLIKGACVRLAGDSESTDPDRIRVALESSNVTVMQATPSMWRLLVAAGWAGSRGLSILCGGEALSPELALSLQARCKRLFNLYGPTETTIWSTLEEVRTPNASRIAIGKPLAGTKVVVLDENRMLVPPAVPGELYIGGAGLAEGYWKAPELTAQRFVPNPFGQDAGERLYRTGDRVRWTHDGRLEFLGRIDHQVKIRGHRIELAEIEHRLRQLEGIRDAAVIAVDDAVGVQRLNAYVVAEGGLTVAAIRASLTECVPSYAMPAAISEVDALPLTPNGKVDRRALLGIEPESVRVSRDNEPGEGTTEARLLDIVSKLLGRTVRPRDDFFDMGGHSLMAVKLVSEIEKEFGTRLPVSVLMHVSTVERLAELIRDGVAEREPVVAMLKEGEGVSKMVLVPGIGGTLLSFRPLVDCLASDVSALGLDPFPCVGEGSSVQQVASACIAASNLAERTGPLWIVAHSMGGCFALEIARQLGGLGAKVRTVMLIDSMAPPDTMDSAGIEQIRHAVDALQELAAGDPRRGLPLGAAEREGNRAMGADTQSGAASELRQRIVAWTEQLEAQNGSEVGRIMMSYRPEPYHGRVVVARALREVEAPLFAAWRRGERDLGWQTYCADPVTVIEVDGDHFSVLTPPFVRALADCLLMELTACHRQPERAASYSADRR
jgi:amino acid adenylation domain-containing protein